MWASLWKTRLRSLGILIPDHWSQGCVMAWLECQEQTLKRRQHKDSWLPWAAEVLRPQQCRWLAITVGGSVMLPTLQDQWIFLRLCFNTSHQRTDFPGLLGTPRTLRVAHLNWHVPSRLTNFWLLDFAFVLSANISRYPGLSHSHGSIACSRILTTWGLSPLLGFASTSSLRQSQPLL